MSETGWKTIRVLRIDGTNYAYQQYHTFAKYMKKGHAGAAMPTGKHRLKPVTETLDEDGIPEELIGSDDNIDL